ncbi:hypothetical protein Sste5346_009868 [Sporothrix stenoceras]|uniref:Enoyl reductase (ER) domain-containing protein n=1 Tax=Sporothrix stenoceras TaxID=5173 RepID=A0ABR3YI83_9PEZI
MDGIKARRTKAYVVDHVGGPFELTEVFLDKLRDDEVLVELLYTGLWQDIVVKDGGMPVGGFPAVLGHEGLGIVREVGPAVADKSLQLGDTVILSFHSCRRCSWCQQGQYGGCPHMTETNFINTARQGVANESPISLADGRRVHGQFFGQSSLSKLTVATEKSVVKIDAQPADLAVLAPLACGYLTGASTVLSVLQPKKTDKVAVLGMGAVGLAAVMAAKARGVVDILAVDIVDEKLRIAAEVGASHTLNTSDLNTGLNEGIRRIFATGVDKIVDATGVVPVINDAVKALGHGGTLALVGVPPPNKTLQIDALDMLLSCKKIMGVIEGLSSPQQAIPELTKLYYEGKFPIDKVATVYPAEDMSRAIDDFKNGRD